MGTNARGHGSWLQIGNQTTWGTAVAATGVRYPIRSFSPKPNFGRFLDESLWGSPFVRTVFEGGRFWDVSFELDLNYLGALKLWDLIFGSSALPTPTVSGPTDSVYVHTFKQGQTVNFKTLEFMEGGVAGLTTVAQFEGFFAEKLTITGKAGTSAESMLRVKVSGIARKMNEGITPASLSLVAQKPVYFHHAVTFTDGSGDAAADVVPKEITIEIARPVVPNRFAFGTSQELLAPLLGGPPVSEITIVKEWQTKSLRTKHLNNTTAAVQVKLQGPELVGTTSKRSIDLSFPTAALVEPWSGDTDRFDVLEETIKWRALYDGTASDATLVATVDSATIAAG